MEKNQENKPATIYDIAKLTGLTGATVSRVLNNRGYIGENTRTKVLEAARKLNYSPNPAARTLKTRRSNQIMLSVPDIQNEFYFEMISAIQEITKKNGYSLLLNYTESNVKEELNMLRNVRENFIDGLILVSTHFSKKHLDEIRNIQKPIVLSTMSLCKITGGEELFDFVGVDTQKGVYLATKYVIDQGHTQIGYAGLPLETQTGDERYKGFYRAMKEAGLEICDRYIYTEGYSEIFGYDTGLKLSKLANRPTAICTGADTVALGLYRAFEQENIRIPEDIGIVGMDNTYITARIKPKMTTVALSQDKIGKTSAELIFDRLENPKKPNQTVIYQPELIVRESVVRNARNP